MRIYNVTIDDNEKLGLTCISLVNRPAVQTDFVKFEDQQQDTIKLSDQYEHKLFGCALRSNFPILRYDKLNQPYYIVFSAETIEKMVERYSEKSLINNVSLQHNGTLIKGAVMTQSFIKNPSKGINPVDFEHIEDGSWFVEMKITDDKLWNQIINSKNLNGFSIEAAVEYELKEQLSEQELMTIDSLINMIINNEN